jgi:hypothetical protein
MHDELWLGDKDCLLQKVKIITFIATANMYFYSFDSLI